MTYCAVLYEIRFVVDSTQNNFVVCKFHRWKGTHAQKEFRQ